MAPWSTCAKVEPGEDVVAIKQGVRATVKDILRQDVDRPKLVIGIFMSPFDVHYNRAPLTATIDFIRRHPARGENAHMGAMQWRTLFNRAPHYEGSVHIVQNERTVTRFVGEYRDAPLSYYVVQIGARTVNGIDSYYREGERVERGAVFGMIRIGSQVDLIVPWQPGFTPRVAAGRPGPGRGEYSDSMRPPRRPSFASASTHLSVPGFRRLAAPHLAGA